VKRDLFLRASNLGHIVGDGLDLRFAQAVCKGRHLTYAIAHGGDEALRIGLDLVEYGADGPLGACILEGVAQCAGWNRRLVK